MLEEGQVLSGTPYKYVNENNEKFFEFHVDNCEKISSWTSWPDVDSAKFGGCLSVRKPEGSKPLIIFGQNECIFKQYVFTKKSWVGPQGQTAMTPKDEGQGLMMSPFVSRDFGFDFNITSSCYRDGLPPNYSRQGLPINIIKTN